MDKTEKGQKFEMVSINNMDKTEKGQKFEMVSINRGLYDKLLKLARYAQDWYPDYEECKNCGALHPKHIMCIQCNYDNSTGKIRE